MRNRIKCSPTRYFRTFLLLSLLILGCLVANLFLAFYVAPPSSSDSTTSIRDGILPPARRQDEVSINNTTRDIEARAFDFWPATGQNTTLPCFEAENRWFAPSAQSSPSMDGLLFMKLYKTGSSTGAGIHLRIATNLARQRKASKGICRARFDHGNAQEMSYGNRHWSSSVLWTIIREPTERAISQFFHFVVSRQNVTPSDEVFQSVMKHQATKDFYLKILSCEPYKTGKNDPIDAANRILEDYDFIGITERMEESAVALQMLLGLRTADVLYLDAKHRGQFDDGGGKKKCTYIQPRFLSDKMQDFFRSAQWKKHVRNDELLYVAANRSLDLTIKRLGQDAFQRNLAIFRHAQAVVKDKCLPRAIFPCTSEGKYVQRGETNCIWNDSGCSNDCLDEVATELELW